MKICFEKLAAPDSFITCIMKLHNAGVRLETMDANEHKVQVQAKKVAFIIGLVTRGQRQINQSSVRAYSRCCFQKYLQRLYISYGLTVELYCQYFDRQGVMTHAVPTLSGFIGERLAQGHPRSQRLR